MLGDNGGLGGGVHAGAVGDLGEVLVLLQVEGGVVLVGVAGDKFGALAAALGLVVGGFGLGAVLALRLPIGSI